MDNYELNNSEKIYPIFKIKIDGKNYLFYSYKEDNIGDDDIFVGEEFGDGLFPVRDDLLPVLEKKYKELVGK